MDLHDFRREYSLGNLSRADLNLDPIQQFEQWFAEIGKTSIKDPSAMIVASCDSQGQPSQRYVLLKKFNSQGFVFFTDTNSTKGREISLNPQLSLLFPWSEYERQVRIQGVAKRLDKYQVEEYFHSRPLGSQLAAASSEQSQKIETRQALESKFEALSEEHSNSVPLPERWGGYIVEPTLFEFWQGGEHRLHDRFRYTLALETKEENSWKIERLQP